mgnify:FL=1
MNKNKESKLKKYILPVLSALLILFTFISLNNRSSLFEDIIDTSYRDFVYKIENKDIIKVEITSSEIFGYEKEENGRVNVYKTTRTTDPKLVDRLLENNIDFIQTKDIKSSLFNILISFGPLLILIYIFNRNMKGAGGIMSVGKSKAKEYNLEKQTGITFADVAGEDEAKDSMKELVDFLHNPEKYNEIGAKLPKGALLVGPPGTGKTLLARALAGEAKVPFYSLAGSDFVEMFVGVGAARVRDIFKTAYENAPCIIFIDEIDAIGQSRNVGNSRNDEREQTLNQLLSEMDGFDSSKGIIVLGATNRPEILDPALLRPGRFDRRIVVENPDLKGRISILEVHTKNVKLDDTVNLKEIALSTSGASGADLSNIINEAAILAVQKEKPFVSQEDLQEAVEVVLVGKEKKDRILNKKEKKIVAYHEIGHALVAALQKNTEPIQKITIIPRTMGSLGYVMQSPEEERFLNTKEELEERLVVLLAGRASEEIFFGTVTTGAANDIEKATEIAKKMITEFGMSEKLGLVSFVRRENRYLGGQTLLSCADETSAEIDREIVKVISEAYEKAKILIKSHMAEMERLSEFLIEKETITGKEFMALLH